MLKVLRFGLTLAWLTTAACDYNNDGPALPDATVPAVSPRDAAAPPGERDAGVPSDARVQASDARAPASLDASADLDAGRTENESFASARLLRAGEGALQDILHSGQTNYFWFDAPTAGFYELKTSANDFSPDVVLSLHDATYQELAQNDQGSLWPGDTVDARLVVRLQTPGRYYVKVDDPSTPVDFFTRSSFAVRYYRLDLRTLTAGAVGLALERDASTPLSFAPDDGSGYAFVTAVGALPAGSQLVLALEGKQSFALIGHVLNSGVSGNGSTAAPARVRVVDRERSTVVGESDGRPEHLQLFPPLREGPFELQIIAPAAPSPNAFYALDLVLLADNPREQDEQGNDEIAGAEPLAMSGAAARRGLLLSDVPGADVDHYSFAASAGETVRVSCEGESAGSGVRSLMLQLCNVSDQVLVTANESAAHELDIASYTVPATGTYFVRLASDPSLPVSAVEPWVRCVVLVSP